MRSKRFLIPIMVQCVDYYRRNGGNLPPKRCMASESPTFRSTTFLTNATKSSARKSAFSRTAHWEHRCSYEADVDDEVDEDDENPYPYGSWATPDGNFFCEWYDGCPPAKIPSAARVCPVVVPGRSRMPTASAWVIPTPMTSSTTSSCRVFSLVCL
jgi:hypothetical protein